MRSSPIFGLIERGYRGQIRRASRALLFKEEGCCAFNSGECFAVRFKAGPASLDQKGGNQ